MKREVLSRQVLARHEAGHVVAMAALEGLGSFSWRRLGRYEFAHAAEPQTEVRGWDEAATRDDMIARRAVFALAGGAAERCAAPSEMEPTDDPAVIHAWTGSVDFELAHEWLTLQRYDGSQQAILADIARLFGEISAFLARPAQQHALAIVADRIAALLNAADTAGRTALSLPAAPLIESLALDPAPRFVLRETIRPASRRRMV
jgi:hypothetical protein